MVYNYGYAPALMTFVLHNLFPLSYHLELLPLCHLRGSRSALFRLHHSGPPLCGSLQTRALAVPPAPLLVAMMVAHVLRSFGCQNVTYPSVQTADPGHLVMMHSMLLTSRSLQLGVASHGEFRGESSDQ